MRRSTTLFALLLCAVLLCAVFATIAYARSGAGPADVFMVLDLDQSGSLTTGELPGDLLAAGGVFANQGDCVSFFASAVR